MINTEYDLIKWDETLMDVVEKFNALRACWEASEKNAPPETHKKLVRDLYLPAITLLARFCVTVKLDGK